MRSLSVPFLVDPWCRSHMSVQSVVSRWTVGSSYGRSEVDCMGPDDSSEHGLRGVVLSSVVHLRLWFLFHSSPVDARSDCGRASFLTERRVVMAGCIEMRYSTNERGRCIRSELYCRSRRW